MALARKPAVIMHRMLVDGAFASAAVAARQGEFMDFGQHSIGFPKRVPPGRWIRSDRKLGSGNTTTRARSVGLSSRTPSGGGLAPTPYRSKCSAIG